MWIPCWHDGIGRKVCLAQLRQLCLVGKFADEAFVLRAGFVGAALLAVAFAEAENGGRGQLPLVVEMIDRGFVIGDGGLVLVIGFLLKKAALEIGGEIVGVRAGGQGRSQREKDKDSK